jgi:hypothetical protein
MEREQPAQHAEQRALDALAHQPRIRERRLGLGAARQMHCRDDQSIVAANLK